MDLTLLLSIIIITHNRCAALRETLDRLAENPCLPHTSMEVIVIDNGSTDDTQMMLDGRADLDIVRIRLPDNEGVSARNHGFACARGKYVLLIDDDSYPMADAVSRCIEYLEMHPQTAAVVGRIELPDGTPEATALPTVIANGAVVLRKSVIDRVGGFPREFFRQAEEYDLSFRIWNAGFRIERFEDLIYRHNKAPGNRSTSDIHYFDVRNNMILLERYFPSALRRAYRRDWMQRYLAFAKLAGCEREANRGYRDGRWQWGLWERLRGRQHPQILSVPALEIILALSHTAQAVEHWAKRHHVRRVMLADYSKNIYAAWRACRDTGLTIAGLYDANPAFIGSASSARNKKKQSSVYRGVSIINKLPEESDDARFDGIILTNTNPAQVHVKYAALRAQYDGPVLRLWEGKMCPVKRRWSEMLSDVGRVGLLNDSPKGFSRHVDEANRFTSC